MTPRACAVLVGITLAGCTPAPDDGENVAALSTAAPIVGLDGKCLDDNAGSSANGTKIQLWSCDGTAAQAWTYSDDQLLGPGGKCLDISDGDQVSGSIVQLYQCNATNAQKWTMSGGTIKSSAGLCLEVRDGGTANGTQIQVATCTGKAQQVWNVGVNVSAPTNLVMTRQTQSTVSLSWSAPASKPDHYRIYRNGAAYDTTTATTYTDERATNANSPTTNGIPTLAEADTIYAYGVSAVSSQGYESTIDSNMTFWLYDDGAFDWGGDYSYVCTPNYADTSGLPEDGAYDIKVTCPEAYGGFQPYAGKTTTLWDTEAGAFKYVSLDLKPTLAGQDWQLLILSRVPIGDVAPWASVMLSKYGPAPLVGKWATYKVPLSELSIGESLFTGSISGTKLTVTKLTSGVGVDGGGFITGAGIPAGTYVAESGTTNGGAGTYEVGGPGIAASTSVVSTSMVEQRTGLYKLLLVDRNSSSPAHNAYYVDNIKLTVD